MSENADVQSQIQVIEKEIASSVPENKGESLYFS